MRRTRSCRVRSTRPRTTSRTPHGKALPIACDIRDENALREAVDAAAAQFGGIDILGTMRARSA
jgi:NAD(P)-dependent dehydrogenase (short-subunit alcohol dehydrogenase family)